MVVLLGFVPDATWLDALGLAACFGVVGGVAGGAFAGVLSLAFRGRRLSELSWVRLGLAGAIVAAVFVPLFLQTMNLLSGDGLVAWNLVLDDAIWTSVLGGSAAAGSLWIAQRSEGLLGDGGEVEVERFEGAGDARLLDRASDDARASSPAPPTRSYSGSRGAAGVSTSCRWPASRPGARSRAPCSASSRCDVHDGGGDLSRGAEDPGMSVPGSCPDEVG